MAQRTVYVPLCLRLCSNLIIFFMACLRFTFISKNNWVSSYYYFILGYVSHFEARDDQMLALSLSASLVGVGY